MKDSIINKNDKGEFHGYVELYWDKILTYRANYKNNNPVGYVEAHGYKKTYFQIR